MNDMTVGMENLPNIYINKVSIYSTVGGYEVVLMLSMYDHTSEPSWRDRIDDLKVKVSFVTDPLGISNLNSGLSSLFDYEPQQSMTMILSPSMFYESETSGNYSTYSSTVRAIIPFEPNNLNVYVACFIDDLGFNNPIFDKFYGPMVGEQLFVGRRINTISKYFYYPDTNEEYGGPVHQHPTEGFMEMSSHSNKPHRKLVMVEEENYKIEAFIDDFESVTPENTEVFDDTDPRGYDDAILIDPSVRTPTLTNTSYELNVDPSVRTPALTNTSYELNVEAFNQAQRPNFNLVGNLTSIIKPTGY